MKFVSRRLRVLLALPVALFGLAVLAGPAQAASPRAVAVPPEVSLKAGLNDPKDPNIAVLEYLPSSIKVAKGTKVTWAIAGPEPHSVTFVPPGSPAPSTETNPALFAPTPPTGPYDGTTLVNSGVLPSGNATTVAKFSMTFSAPGNYTYYCVLHPGMIGKIQVTDDTQDSQKSITKKGNSQQSKWIAEGVAAKKKLTKTAPKQTENADGTTTYTVQMGASTAHTDVLAFSPTPRKVGVGDRVTFVNNSLAPHTASFGGPLVPTNPIAPNVMSAVPGPSPQPIVPNVYLNTGWLPPNTGGASGPPLAARSYTYIVPGPGTFTYACVLHLPSGMAGEIDAS